MKVLAQGSNPSRNSGLLEKDDRGRGHVSSILFGDTMVPIIE